MARLACPLCGQQVSATRQGLAQHERAGGGRCLPEERSELKPGAFGCAALAVGAVAGVTFSSWPVFWLCLLVAVAVYAVRASTPAARVAVADRRAIEAVQRESETTPDPVVEPVARDVGQEARRLLEELPALGSTTEDAIAACMVRLGHADPQALSVRFTKLARAHVAADERILALVVAEGSTARGVPLLAILTDRALVVKEGGVAYRDEEPRLGPGGYGYLASGPRLFFFKDHNGLEVAVAARALAASSRSSSRSRKAVSAARPPGRLIREARDAELVAVEWMRYLGFEDAVATPVGADGGIDVTSSRAVAQVKMEARPTGRPVVQQLHGVCVHEGKTGVFFSLAGYTSQARTWAETSGTVLFRFDYQGSPEPVNAAAHELLAAADARTRR
ncbi:MULTISPECIES: restriction endonuclease [unclassified Streptomyces]|uniref:restriction endonuclease n=1 Tax=unclassified Streptomyces TaxID=2593676 RepID=UPI002E32BA60|nr:MULTISPECIES: restriction endonuclease [unclassified Streptomyces]